MPKVILLAIFTCCYYSNLNAQSDFYLKKMENAIPNQEGEVLVHFSEIDSLFLNPLMIDTLGLDLTSENYFIFKQNISNFANIRCLWMRFCCVEQLPDEICTLQKLEFLDLQHSCIKTLPDDFGNLTNLKELILLYSQIERLPDSFTKLTQLQTLKLVNTRLTSFPNHMENLTHLWDFPISYYQNERMPNRRDKKNARKLKKAVKKLKKKIVENQLPKIRLSN